MYCDHVGGPIAEAVYENMALFGTIAISGLLDYYSSSKRSPGPKNYDLILMKRLRVEGFFSPDFYHREKEFNPILKNWLDENNEIEIISTSQSQHLRENTVFVTVFYHMK